MKGKLFGVVALLVVAGGLLYWLWSSEYTVRNANTPTQTYNQDTLKVDVYAALDGTAVTAPDRMDISFVLKKEIDQTTGATRYQADYQNPIDEFDRAFIAVAEGQHVAAFSSTGGATLVAIPFYVNYGGTGSFLYTGLFSFKDGDLTYIDASGVGDRVSVTSLENGENGQVVLKYKTRYSNEGMAAEPTVPAFAVYTADANSIDVLKAGENAAMDIVLPSTPAPNGEVNKTFTVAGRARGTWYFEASFPVSVIDGVGTVVGQGFAQAQGDWMTENYVPYTGTIAINSYTGPATLILHKDNASGDPERDAFISIPILVQ